MCEQIAAELRDVAARPGEPFARLERGAAIAFRDRVGRSEDQRGVRNAQHREHVVRLDALAAVGDELIEGAERVAEASGGRACDRSDCAVVDLDRLSLCDAAKHLGDLLRRGAREVEALAAIDDRGHDLVRFRRREDEDGGRRWLLERLQERVPRLSGEHVGLVQDVDLPLPRCGGEADPVAELADVID